MTPDTLRSHQPVSSGIAPIPSIAGKTKLWVLPLALGLALTVIVTGQAFAADEATPPKNLDLVFVERLRERGYHDTALLFLDRLQARPQLDPSVKESISFERAMTLLDAAKSSRDAKSKSNQLDQALAFLNQFAKEAPNHPEAATANLRRSEILLAKAAAEVSNARQLQGNAAAEANERAKAAAAEARGILATAEKQYEEKLKGFPTHIDKAADPEKFAARTEAENLLISVQLDWARSHYEEAQAFPADSAEKRQLLQTATEAYEKLFQKYRNSAAGQVAHMWQGKCYEEQGDLPKALGIYKEVLSQPDNSPAMTALKDQARQFQMICLNRKSPPDYLAVTQQGEEWVKNHRSQLRSRVGLGIRLETAKAYEGLGDDRNLIKPEQVKFWRLGAAHAREISQFGEFAREGNELLSRLEKKIGGDEKTPDNFEAALFVAQAKMQERQEKQRVYEDAVTAKKPAAELAAMKQELSLLDQEAMQAFALTLRLAGNNEDPVKVNHARYLYGLCAYLTGRSYEASVISEQASLMAKGDEETQVALDAAFLSVMSLIQAYVESPLQGQVREEQLNAIIIAANRMLKRYPDTEKANDVRMQVGNLFKNQKRYIEAAQWFDQIPATGGKYAEAQMQAGQSYWNAYLKAPSLPVEERPDAATLADWKKTAQKKLELGIAKITENLPPGGKSPPELISGKWSLAQILIGQGQDKDAVKLLTEEPHSPRAAIKVADETKRPMTGIQGRPFASETLKLLVRAYIGAGQTKEANQAMKDLEATTSGQAGADVTQLYIGISKLLKEELDRFKGTGETERYTQLRSAFEEFMNDLSMRTEGQTWSSLSWIGETYAALGEASEGDTDKQDQFYGKSVEAFESILNKSQAEPDFANANQLLSTKVRLIRAYRMKKNFEAGEKLVKELLANRKNDVLLQTQAAELYLDWGSTDSQYLNVALVGDRASGVWGFGPLGQRLQQAMDSGRSDLLPQYLDARHNAGLARIKLAESAGDQKKRAEQLRNAEVELVGSLSVLPELTEEQRGRFNKLYRTILEAAGKDVVDLPEVVAVEIVAKPETPEEATTPAAEEKTTKKAVAKTAPVLPMTPAKANQSDGLIYTAVALVLLGCLAVIGYFVYKGMKKPPKRASRKISTGNFSMDIPPLDLPSTFASFDPENPAISGAAKTATKTATRTRPSTSPATGSESAPATAAPARTATERPAAPRTPSAEKTAGSRPAPEKSAEERPARPATPRPRPKPPADPAP